MAEIKDLQTEIKKVKELIDSNKITSAVEDLVKTEKAIKEIKAKLNEVNEKLLAKKQAETVVEPKKVEEVEPVSAPKEETKVEEVAPVKKVEEVSTEVKPTEVKPTEVEKGVSEEVKPVKKELPSFIVRRNEYVPTDKPKREERPNRDGANQGGFKKDGQNAYKGNNKDFNKPKKPVQNTYVAPENIPTVDKRAQGKKKQNVEKSYEEKRVINKRALVKNNLTVDDFDENKTGYRKFRPVKKNKEQAEVKTIKIEKAVITTEVIPLKVLSEKIGITAAEITKRLFKEGIMKTINDSVDFDTAAFIAADIGVELELKLDKTAEDVFSAGYNDLVDEEKDLITRPPVVTVMGHVDHGKTSILDRIRKTNVTAGEAGGITQHIGAYQVTVNGEVITFLDTPGHAAFTAMRARGAKATDIAVLVVAGDDGIMPQTIEAINHAKAAEVPIIVAVNKMDKPEANLDRVKTGLTEHGLVPEEWGGDTIICPVSAKTGMGFDELLNSILLVAEMKELKANPKRKAKGVIIEAKLDQSKGPIATVLIENGTLKVGDSVIVGSITGKVRAMMDDKGRKIAKAGPSTPVSIMGLEEVPNAGDVLFGDDNEKLIKQVAEERRTREREGMIKTSTTVSLDDVFSKIKEGEMKVLNIIVKADVQGSSEAVKSSLEKLSNEQVRVNVIHSAVGAIKESDIMLAESSNAIIIGFNVRPDSNAKQISEKSGVDIKLYRIIYEAIEDVEKALKGMLAPKFTEVYLGKAEVRDVFKISGVGQVAGCYVVDGKIIRSGKLRIYRDDVMITEGNVLQLKRFKDDVKEVAYGFECGISIERFNDIKVGDFIECYQVEQEEV